MLFAIRLSLDHNELTCKRLGQKLSIAFHYVNSWKYFVTFPSDAWQHQAITWANVDVSPIRSSDIQLRAFSLQTPQPSITKISWQISFLKFHSNLPEANELTLNVRGPSILGLTRSISWLLMPWLLTSPGHQQPWYWLCKIGRFLSYLRKDFNYLCRINVEIWHKM